ncbi:MAG: hydantoinase/oxoprolinase family protein [Hyphomicrobiaceae bacterium]
MSEVKHIAIGADIGGTFTDVVVVDERNHAIHSAKVLTTPEQPERAVLTAVDDMLQRVAAPPSALRTLVHGTTLATNAIIERKGARTLLLTTKGFRDALETRTELRYDLYDLFIQFPEPLVPRRRRIGIEERTLFEGSVQKPLVLEEIEAALSSEHAQDIEAIAVCFLHSYANPANEIAARSVIEAALPDVPISLSSEVLPEIGEYGRTSTTVANAYVQPLIDKYLGALDEALSERGSTGAFFVMGSNAGTLSLDVARKHPVRLVESGPAAGVSIAAHYARARDISHLLSFDMGGTTAKIALVTDFEPARASELEVARVKRFQKGSGLLLKAPAVELIEIGAGGGSIARVDDALGLLSVGPESAGSSPGPACYGQGGEWATVTDADVVLGYLNPDYFLGGKMQLDRSRSATAIDRFVGKPMSVGTEQAAASIFEVVNDNMANAAAVYSAEQGIDLRNYSLLAFGGAAPAHAWDVARRLGISQVRIPFAAGVLSALGCLTSPMSFDFVFGYMCELAQVDWTHVNQRFAELEEQGRQQLRDAGIDEDVTVTLSADMRYYGQRYEVAVLLPQHPFNQANAGQIQSDFYEAYRSYYGRKIDVVPVETVSWRMNISGPRPQLDIAWPGRMGDSQDFKPKGRRSAVFPGANVSLSCEVFERGELPVGARVTGPAIIEDHESTTIVPPGATLYIDEERMIVLDLDGVSI